MKKAKIFIKNNIKLLIGFILGIIISAGGVYAAIVIQGSSVGYTDNYSLGATTVQAAIDKLYTKATTEVATALAKCPPGYSCTQIMTASGSSIIVLGKTISRGTSLANACTNITNAGFSCQYPGDGVQYYCICTNSSNSSVSCMVNRASNMLVCKSGSTTCSINTSNVASCS